MNYGVLLTCHGTVEDLDDMPGFLKNIRRGRPAPAEMVAEIRERYEAIGGSPLMATTRKLAAAVQEHLQVPVRCAARLWHPYPSEVIGELVAAGSRRVVSVPLAPQSVHVYHPDVVEACTKVGVDCVQPPTWGLEPRLLDGFERSILEAVNRFDSATRVGVILSAHSLPMRILKMGDPYERDFREMADAVAARLASSSVDAADIMIAFQSQGMSGGEWLGPDLPTTFQECAAKGLKHVVVAPIGFLAEHVETLYDIDIEAKGLARNAGLDRIERMPALDTCDELVEAIGAVVRRNLEQA